jgi:hypothetical protein
MATAHTPRVFGIGLNKTGTTSLHEALLRLGYNALHWGGPAVRQRVLRALSDGRPLLTYLPADLDAFTDIEDLSHNFDLLDAQYPGSKFILTVRPLDDWLDSRRRHVENNQAKRAQGAYHGTFLEVDIDGWIAEYEAHHARVWQYFAGRPHQLLVVDVTANPAWGPLCEFLGQPEPAEPFPWANRYRPWAARTTGETTTDAQR